MKKRILSGMRPHREAASRQSSRGRFSNWVDIQNKDIYDCFYFVADWHALTSDYKDTDLIKANSLDMVVDWLSVGLDPARSTMFVQSEIMEHAELFLILSMITPLSWLERNPTYKEMQEELSNKDIGTFGFSGIRYSRQRT